MSQVAAPGAVDPDLDTLSADDLDRLDLGVIGLDPTGRILTFNDAASTLSGFSRDAVGDMGPAAFDDAAFEVKAGANAQALHLK